MSILAQCPVCRQKQSVKNKICRCGADLDKLKRSRRVRFWINYRLGGKQWREPVGYSITEARAAEGKRLAQKRENRIFDVLPESKMTFGELIDWYLDLQSVKKLASFDRYEDALNNFTAVFGQRLLDEIKQVDLENYQIKRREQGRADATIDTEIKIAQTAVTKAFDNDMIAGICLKAFRKTKHLLEHGSNARKTVISIDQYVKLLKHSLAYFRPVLIMAFNTGMRKGEIKKLRWSYIDRDNMIIRLPKEITKEKRDKDIPINHNVKDVLDSLPRSIVHDYVITHWGKPVKERGQLRKQFPNACREAGIPYGTKVSRGIIFHDIRRTVKTNMVSAGVDKALRDTILGHSLKGMDVNYIALTDDMLTEAMDKYTMWLDNQLAFANVDQNVDQPQV